MTAHCIGCEQQTQFRPSLLSLPSRRVKLEPKNRMLSQALWFLKQITNNKDRFKCGQFHFIPLLFQGLYIGAQFLNSYLTQLFCKAEANEDIESVVAGYSPNSTQQQQQQHQKLYLHDHKGITVLQKLLI